MQAALQLLWGEREGRQKSVTSVFRPREYLHGSRGNFDPASDLWEGNDFFSPGLGLGFWGVHKSWPVSQVTNKVSPIHAAYLSVYAKADCPWASYFMR